MDDRRGISGELAEGIRRYEVRVAPLLGRTVETHTPDGKTHVGVFGELAKGQPVVTRADGVRISVSVPELDRLVAEASS